MNPSLPLYDENTAYRQDRQVPEHVWADEARTKASSGLVTGLFPALKRLACASLLRCRLMLILLIGGLVTSGFVQADEIRFSLPPDPNALPIFILQAKKAQFLPEDSLTLIANPAGDPSAMRAMIQAGRMDFALFNLVGGTRFIQGGLENVHLVAPWVWRGIYLLTPETGSALPALTGQTILVSPGLSTPPHVVTQKALLKSGVEAKFVAGGSGAVLLSLLADPARAPAAVAAAEPQVSLILHRQRAEDWKQKWTIGFDPADALGGEIPLGALWQIGDRISPAARERLVKGLIQAATWAQNPQNHAEAARIGASGYAQMFRLPLPEAALQDMLDKKRVVWRLDQGPKMRETVTTYLNDVFGVQTPPALFQAE